MNRSGQLPNLEKLFKDEGEQDFTPLGGSNLATLFENPLRPSDANSSLKFHPPKKNNDKNSIQTQPTNKTEVIVGKTVHAHKLQNGQYSLIGKVGLALTGNLATNTYILILYRNKTEYISIAKLASNFSYSVLENNYATYYDSNNVNWSILFETTEASVELAREIGLSKYLLKQEKSDGNVLYQDLTVSSEGEKAEEGDKISVKCSIFTSITQPLKISTALIQETTVEITSDNNWERSLINTGKNLRRILFLSPSKQISLGPGFPRDKDVALEIEIIGIVRPEPVQMTSPNPIKSGKASLISRMAKMGQSILPKLPSSTATDSEDTEEEVHVKSPRRLRHAESDVHKKNPQSNKPSPSAEQFTELPIQSGHSRGLQQNSIISSPSTIANNPHGTIVSTIPFANAWSSVPMQQQYFSTVDGQLYPIQSPLPQPVTATVDPNINIFLSETRTHNAEIRMGMSKIADNVQKLLDKFHVLEMQNATSPNSEKALESSLKMLIALKNEKIGNNTLEIDRISMINESSGSQSSIEELKRLEDDLNTAKKSLNESWNRLEAVEIEKRNINEEKLQFEEKIQKLELSLSDTQNEFQKVLFDLKSANDVTIKCQRDNATLEAKIITLNAKVKILEDAATLNKNTNTIQDNKAAEIKQIMNKTYQTLITKFTEDSYTTDYIKATVAKTIRAITLHVLQENKNNKESHSSNDELMKKSRQNSSEIEPSEVNSTVLPDIDENTRPRMNSGVEHEKPPPIPPMDLEIDSEWSL